MGVPGARDGARPAPFRFLDQPAGIPQMLASQRLLLKPHLLPQAHFKCHHLQEALSDTPDPLLNFL